MFHPFSLSDEEIDMSGGVAVCTVHYVQLGAHFQTFLFLHGCNLNGSEQVLPAPIGSPQPKIEKHQSVLNAF